jgi:hypothetical protein
MKHTMTGTARRLAPLETLWNACGWNMILTMCRDCKQLCHDRGDDECGCMGERTSARAEKYIDKTTQY